jgi:uncharacterized protein
MSQPPQTRPWRRTDAGLVLRLHLTPRSSRDAVEGIGPAPAGVALKARVRAVPEDGKANAALETLVAEWLGLGRRAVAVTGGSTSRTKSLTLHGAPDDLIRRLEVKLAAL